MLRLFCSNTHPSNSHRASHRGKAEDDEDDKNEKGRRRKDTDKDEDEDGKGQSHDEEEDEDETDIRRQKGQSFSWRVQNRTLKDSGENRTIRHVVL